jgi:hypothetical protein
VFRLDTTLVDFNDMHWERGDISFVFNGSQRPQESLTVLDNKLGVYQRIRYEVKRAIFDSFYYTAEHMFVLLPECI